MSESIEVHTHPQGALINVKARAGGSRNAVTGVLNGVLRVSVTQIAEGGKANRAIVDVLAHYFGCAKSRIQILKGDKTSQKSFLLVDWAPDDVQRRHEGQMGR